MYLCEHYQTEFSSECKWVRNKSTVLFILKGMDELKENSSFLLYISQYNKYNTQEVITDNWGNEGKCI